MTKLNRLYKNRLAQSSSQMVEIDNLQQTMPAYDEENDHMETLEINDISEEEERSAPTLGANYAMFRFGQADGIDVFIEKRPDYAFYFITGYGTFQLHADERAVWPRIDQTTNAKQVMDAVVEETRDETMLADEPPNPQNPPSDSMTPHLPGSRHINLDQLSDDDIALVSWCIKLALSNPPRDWIKIPKNLHFRQAQRSTEQNIEIDTLQQSMPAYNPKLYPGTDEESSGGMETLQINETDVAEKPYFMPAHGGYKRQIGSGQVDGHGVVSIKNYHEDNEIDVAVHNLGVFTIMPYSGKIYVVHMDGDSANECITQWTMNRNDRYDMSPLSPDVADAVRLMIPILKGERYPEEDVSAPKDFGRFAQSTLDQSRYYAPRRDSDQDVEIDNLQQTMPAYNPSLYPGTDSDSSGGMENLKIEELNTGEGGYSGPQRGSRKVIIDLAANTATPCRESDTIFFDDELVLDEGSDGVFYWPEMMEGGAVELYDNYDRDWLISSGAIYFPTREKKTGQPVGPCDFPYGPVEDYEEEEDDTIEADVNVVDELDGLDDEHQMSMENTFPAGEGDSSQHTRPGETSYRQGRSAQLNRWKLVRPEQSAGIVEAPSGIDGLPMTIDGLNDIALMEDGYWFTCWYRDGRIDRLCGPFDGPDEAEEAADGFQNGWECGSDEVVDLRNFGGIPGEVQDSAMGPQLPRKFENSKESRSAILALIPTDAARKEIASAMGDRLHEAPEELHITLAYLGKGLSDEDIEKVGSVLDAMCPDYEPLNCRMQGLGVFDHEVDGGRPFYASVDALGLAKLRTELMEAIEDSGVEMEHKYDFTPHMTLGYIDASLIELAEGSPGVEWTSSEIVLMNGGEHTKFKLGSVDKEAQIDKDPKTLPSDMQVVYDSMEENNPSIESIRVKQLPDDHKTMAQGGFAVSLSRKDGSPVTDLSEAANALQMFGCILVGEDAKSFGSWIAEVPYSWIEQVRNEDGVEHSFYTDEYGLSINLGELDPNLIEPNVVDPLNDFEKESGQFGNNLVDITIPSTGGNFTQQDYGGSENTQEDPDLKLGDVTNTYDSGHGPLSTNFDEPEMNPLKYRGLEIFDNEEPWGMKQAAVGSLMQILKMPQDIAEYAQNEWGDAAFAISAIWMHAMDAWKRNKNESQAWYDVPNLDKIFGYADIFKRYPKFIKYVNSNWKDEGVQFRVDDMVNQSALDDHAEAQPLLTPVIQFPDGFHWVEVTGPQAKLDGKLMQHCGVGAGRMYSLRDAKNRPHVTVDVVDKVYGQPAAGLTIDQIAGKQNSLPAAKYMPYIEEFISSLGIKYFWLKSQSESLGGILPPAPDNPANGRDEAGIMPFRQIDDNDIQDVVNMFNDFDQQQPHNEDVVATKQASVGSIVRILGFSKEVAEIIHAQCPQEDMALAKLLRAFVTQYDPDTMSKHSKDVVIMGQRLSSLITFLQDVELFDDISDKQVASAINKAPHDTTFKELHSIAFNVVDAKHPSALTVSDAVLTLPDGSYWVRVSDEECRLEGMRMQHCGEPEGQMYSLRDKNGKPHVTVDIGETGDGGGDDYPVILQMKGKQNARIHSDYIESVKALTSKLKIKFYNSSNSGDFGDSFGEALGLNGYECWNSENENEIGEYDGADIPRIMEIVNEAYALSKAIESGEFIIDSDAKYEQVSHVYRELFNQDEGCIQINQAIQATDHTFSVALSVYENRNRPAPVNQALDLEEYVDARGQVHENGPMPPGFDEDGNFVGMPAEQDIVKTSQELVKEPMNSIEQLRRYRLQMDGLASWEEGDAKNHMMKWVQRQISRLERQVM